MSIKGKAKTKKADYVRELFVGFAQVKVVAINPTRAEMNELLGIDSDEEREEFKYLDTVDGKDRLRLSFWLYDDVSNKYFIQTVNLINEDRISKDGKKVQLINSVCNTTWVPLKEDKNGNVTGEPDTSFAKDFFLNFTNKEKEVIGAKKVRKAIRGEEELGILLRAWLDMEWYDPDTEIMIDISKLFGEDLRELKNLIGGSMTNPFVILTGVRTDKEDETKKYQQVFSKAYLPSSFMRHIKAGNKMPSEYTKNVWKKFTDEVAGEYGFGCYHRLVPLTKYDEDNDPVATNQGKITQPQDNEY